MLTKSDNFSSIEIDMIRIKLIYTKTQRIEIILSLSAIELKT